MRLSGNTFATAIVVSIAVLTSPSAAAQGFVSASGPVELHYVVPLGIEGPPGAPAAFKITASCATTLSPFRGAPARAGS